MPQHRRLRQIGVFLVVVATVYQQVARADGDPDRITNSGEETFEIERGGDVPFVAVETCGRTLHFAVSTASRVTTFANRHRHLLRISRPDGRTPTAGETGAKSQIFEAPPMLVGHLALKLERVFALDFEKIEEQTGRQIDGSLGLDALRQYVIQFDFHHGFLRFLSRVPADAGEEIPLSADQYGRLAIEFSLGGQAPRLFTPATTLTSAIGIRSGLFTTLCGDGIVQLPDRMSLALAARPRMGVQGIAVTAQLGGFSHRQAQVQTDKANHLGLDYLTRYVVTFDFPREKAYFQKSPAYDFPSGTDQSGLSIAWCNSQFVVKSIWPMSPASESGFLKHDVIKRVDGESADAFTLFRLRRLLHAQRKTVSVTVARDEKLLDLKVALRDFRNLEKEDATRAVAERESGRSRGGAEVLEEFDVARHGAALAVSIRLEGIGRPLLVLVDTGTSASGYDPRLRGHLGTSLGFGQFSTPLQPVRAEEVRAPAARLGKIELAPESICLLTDLKRLNEETGHDFDGIMGMDYLCRQIVQIDFDAGKLRLLSAVPADAGRKIPIEYPPSGVPAAMLDVGRTAQEWFRVDTGWMTDETALTQPVFQDLKDKGEITSIRRGEHRDALGSGGPPLAAEVGSVSSFGLGPFRHRSLRVASANDNVLSLAYLSRYRVTFDFPGRAIYLKEGRRYARPDAVNCSGLLVVKRDDAIVVDAITLGSPGDEAGFRVGDEIVRVNGANAAKSSLFELRELFTTDGRTVKVVVLRDSAEIGLTLELRDHSDSE